MQYTPFDLQRFNSNFEEHDHFCLPTIDVVRKEGYEKIKMKRQCVITLTCYVHSSPHSYVICQAHV